jgi:hypothetical protein
MADAGAGRFALSATLKRTIVLSDLIGRFGFEIRAFG